MFIDTLDKIKNKYILFGGGGGYLIHQAFMAWCRKKYVGKNPQIYTKAQTKQQYAIWQLLVFTVYGKTSSIQLW